MVPLPLFKFASLFVKHISKYGANHIKAQAHDHPQFRRIAARYGQTFHQINMRLSVASMRNIEAELKAKDKAEAPTVKTKEQTEKETELRAKLGTTNAENRAKKILPRISVWKRKFRPLPEAKAVDLFADVIGDGFILFVASALIFYEYLRSSQKPDHNREKIEALAERFDRLEEREKELAEAEEQHRLRTMLLEDVLRGLEHPKTKRPLLPCATSASQPPIQT